MRCTLTDARAGGVDTCRGYPIASISLAVVEAAVCGAKHFVDCAQAVEMTGLRSRGADAHRDTDLPGARGNWLGAHGATDAGRHRFRSFKPGIRQHHDELLAAGACDPIAFRSTDRTRMTNPRNTSSPTACPKPSLMPLK